MTESRGPPSGRRSGGHQRVRTRGGVPSPLLADPGAVHTPPRPPLSPPAAAAALGRGRPFRLVRDPIKVKVPTYAELAEALLFDLTQLAVGQPAPPLEGRDAQGKEFRLA